MSANLRKARDIFIAAVAQVDPDHWGAYLAEACGEDADLRQRVEHLLQLHVEAGSFLESPARALVATVDEQSLREGPGTVIGPYKLLEPIGEGGFGVVYMAEQQQPVRRKVALKVLKPGMDTRQVVARFEAERQALALMDHPHIAKVLDAGATESGRPFFVMELVRGIPLTQFCDANRLILRQRLELFVAVCQAVQHAHTKGVIHRDLKPSNVLVTLHDGVPVAKVIDFGIAKALGQRLTDKTLFTGFAQLVGTPLYMSPEQAELSGLDVDTRSDIYSLGVLLYELLTGTILFDQERLSKVGLDELRRIIREEEPPKPSTRLSTLGQAAATVSANRQSDPKKLSQLLRGELDWVVMKALEKDRSRRYETANGFAMDVQRYLADEPVLACPPSAWYRLGKFARRHKRVLLTASVVAGAVLLAVAALAVSTVLTQRANQDLHQALDRERDTLDREREAREGERLTAYFQRVALAEREWSANNLSQVETLLAQCPEDLRGWEWHYLNRLLRGKGPPRLRHDSAALSAAISPDGALIASSSLDGMITIWDASTAQQRLRFRAHPAQARSVAFSPDGRRLASCSWNPEDLEKPGEVKVWDVRTGQELLDLKGHARRVNHVAFSPDGRLLASAGRGQEGRGFGEVRLWDAATGRHLFSIRGDEVGAIDLVFSPDGQRLATCNYAQVQIWDAQTGRETLTFRGHSNRVSCVAFSPDGRLVASGSGMPGGRVGGEVRVWEGQTGRELLTVRGHVNGVNRVTFSADGRRLATGGVDGVVKLWDVRTGQEALTLRGHNTAIRTVTFSADGHHLVTAYEEGTVCIWDASPWQLGEPGQALVTLSGHAKGVKSVAFCPQGRRLASAGADAIVKVWDLGTRKELFALPRYEAAVYEVAFSPDGRLLATGSSGGRSGCHAYLWDAATGKLIRTLHPYFGEVRTVAFTPDGRRLASAGNDGVVRVWDVTTGEQVQELRGHDYAIHSVAFSPDGRHLASAGHDHTVRLWDVEAAQEIARLEPPHASSVRSVAFRPDGKRLASGSHDRTVRLWERGTDARSWKLVHLPPDFTSGVNSVAFSPDGRLLAWGGTDSAVKVWDEATGETHTLRGHTGGVQSVAFSPDGKSIASASQDGTIKIWETPRSQRAVEAAGNPGK